MTMTIGRATRTAQSSALNWSSAPGLRRIAGTSKCNARLRQFEDGERESARQQSANGHLLQADEANLYVPATVLGVGLTAVPTVPSTVTAAMEINAANRP